MNKIIQESIRQEKETTYQTAMRNLADDFNNGMLTFQEYERAKKQLHKDIFGY